MRKFIIILTLFAIAFSVASCQQKQVENIEQNTGSEPVVKPYQAVHINETIDLKDLTSYTYFYAPFNKPAKDVTVKYDLKRPYAAPIIVNYTYQNGNTYTYIIPKEFGLRTNELGRLKLIQDKYNTVWMQGQTADGKFYEIVLYGDSKFNEVKIKPNSHLNHPYGVIEYCN